MDDSEWTPRVDVLSYCTSGVKYKTQEIPGILLYKISTL